jgi:hypothetical protein
VCGVCDELVCWARKPVFPGSRGVHGGAGTLAVHFGAVSPGHAGEDILGQVYLGSVPPQWGNVFKDGK